MIDCKNFDVEMVEARRRLLAQQLSAALQKDALTDLVNQFAVPGHAQGFLLQRTNAQVAL